MPWDRGRPKSQAATHGVATGSVFSLDLCLSTDGNTARLPQEDQKMTFSSQRQVPHIQPPPPSPQCRKDRGFQGRQAVTNRKGNQESRLFPTGTKVLDISVKPRANVAEPAEGQVPLTLGSLNSLSSPGSWGRRLWTPGLLALGRMLKTGLLACSVDVFPQGLPIEFWLLYLHLPSPPAYLRVHDPSESLAQRGMEVRPRSGLPSRDSGESFCLPELFGNEALSFSVK